MVAGGVISWSLSDYYPIWAFALLYSARTFLLSNRHDHMLPA